MNTTTDNAQGLREAIERAKELCDKSPKLDRERLYARAVTPFIESILATHPPQQERAAELERVQPCGCVLCVCLDEERCHGCGAKRCGTPTASHPEYVRVAAPAAPATPETMHNTASPLGKPSDLVFATPESAEPVALPIDATDEMIRAAMAVDWTGDLADGEAFVHNVWHAMLAAAPVNKQVGWYNTKYGTFFRLAELSATERNSAAMAAGEIIRVYAHPTPAASDGGLREAIAALQNYYPGGTTFIPYVSRHELDAVLTTPPTEQAKPSEPVAPVARVSGDVRAALLFALWHHLGGSSRVGQPLRAILGIGTHAHLDDDQLAAAKRVAATLNSEPVAAPAQVTDASEAIFPKTVIASLMSTRDRMKNYLTLVYGDQFDGDLDNMQEAIAALQRARRALALRAAQPDAGGVVDTALLIDAVRHADRSCPCGARGESPSTHPHVPGCPVGAAMDSLAGQQKGGGR